MFQSVDPQAQVTSGAGQVGSGAVGVAGNVVTVPLTNVPNAQTINVTLFGVNNGSSVGSTIIPMSVLQGDTSGNGSVSGTDISQTRGRVGQPINDTNFRSDVIITNSINSTDVSTVKTRSGTGLP